MKATEQRPILRPIDAKEASRLSIWSNRIAGIERWNKPKRCKARIEVEYEGWYGDKLAKWIDFVHKLAPDQRHPGSILRFLDKEHREHNAAILRNQAIYGSVDLKEYVISIADQLYAADKYLFEDLWRAFIVERVVRAHESFPFGTLVEAGCGMGDNLFNLYLRLGLTGIAGCDLSSSAICLCKNIVCDLRINAGFEVGDFSDVSIINALAPAHDNWALLSVHSIEQAEALTVDWLKRLISLENPPVLGMHFEPLHWGDESHFAQQCVRYAELNCYNKDFLNVVLLAEAEGVVKVILSEKRVIGVREYNPTSVLMWVPVL